MRGVVSRSRLWRWKWLRRTCPTLQSITLCGVLSDPHPWYLPECLFARRKDL